MAHHRRPPVSPIPNGIQRAQGIGLGRVGFFRGRNWGDGVTTLLQRGHRNRAVGWSEGSLRRAPQEGQGVAVIRNMAG